MYHDPLISALSREQCLYEYIEQMSKKSDFSYSNVWRTYIWEGAKFMGYPGRVLKQGGQGLFWGKNMTGRDFFFKVKSPSPSYIFEKKVVAIPLFLKEYAISRAFHSPNIFSREKKVLARHILFPKKVEAPLIFQIKILARQKKALPPCFRIRPGYPINFAPSCTNTVQAVLLLSHIEKAVLL